jgi:spore maturation protein CgeB
MNRTAPLDLVVLGLSLSSAWGNGHATTWRALLAAFAERGHRILFLERDMPWYAAHRDLTAPDYCRLAFYCDPSELHARWGDAIARADAVIVGSYVPDGVLVGDLVQQLARGLVAFYDIDTPVTLAALERGDCAYLAPEQIARYGLYLSFTGGPILAQIMRRLGSPAARVLHCAVDADAYRPLAEAPKRWDLSYLGTYSADRQPLLERLLMEPARQAPQLRFVVAGPLYPSDIVWPPNVERMEHVGPADHPAFYAASRFTLNITRADMRRAGHSPSVRLFEAAACGTPVISDHWTGLDALFRLGHDILVADGPEAVLSPLLGMTEPQRQALGEAARRRVLAGHTARHRAAELEQHLRTAAGAKRAGRTGQARPIAELVAR